jgi:hypothetical protein
MTIDSYSSTRKGMTEKRLANLELLLEVDLLVPRLCQSLLDDLVLLKLSRLPRVLHRPVVNRVSDGLGLTVIAVLLLVEVRQALVEDFAVSIEDQGRAEASY